MKRFILDEIVGIEIDMANMHRDDIEMEYPWKMFRLTI